MAFIPVANCVQVRTQLRNDNSVVAQNVHYVATTSVPTPEDLEIIGGLFQDWFFTSWQGMVTSDWNVDGVILRAMNEEEGIETNYTEGFPVAGTAAGTPTPLQVSYTVTWASGLVGRSARGRSYGVGLATGSITNGNRLTDLARSEFQTRWANLPFILAEGGHALQIVSFVDAGVPRAAGRKLPVAATNVRFPVATQRRRLA